MALVVQGDTCGEVWEHAVMRVVKEGTYVASVRGPVLEILNVALVVKCPQKEPRISPRSPLFQNSEMFLSSVRNHPRIVNWYGMNQLDKIVGILERDMVSRRAVITLWDPQEDLKAPNPQGVVSCNFAIRRDPEHRRDMLHLTSTFRTTDAWMCNWSLAGMPDVQCAVVERLRSSGKELRDLTVGSYTQIHYSFHLYLDDVNNVRHHLLGQ